MRTPRAFSIVELLTALVLLAVGVAAYARAATAVSRLENQAHLRSAVAAVERARLDSLADLPCGTSREGTAAHRGILERWTLRPDARHAVLDQRLDVPSWPSLSRRVVTPIPCQP